jgi:hypothetical protein
MIDHFHFVFGEVIHACHSSQQIKTEFIADRSCDFNKRIFFDDETAKARARVSGDNAGETRGQV